MFSAYAASLLLIPVLAGPLPVKGPAAAVITEADRALVAYDPTEPPWPESNAPFSSTLGVGQDAAAQLDIAEAVLRRLTRHNESGLGRKASAHCLELFGKAAPRSLVRRLSGSWPPVRAGCDSKGKRVILSVSSIRVIDADHAEASGGYHEGTLSSASHSYWLRRTKGGWEVVGDVTGFIS